MLSDVEEMYKTQRSYPGKPIVKKGTLAIGVVESTPVVWKGELLRFEWIRNARWGIHKNIAKNKIGCFHFVSMATEEGTPEFAFDHSFGCCHVEDDKMYVVGTRGGGGNTALDMFVSDDLEHWTESVALEFPEDIQLYNTSICKGEHGYVMAIEIGGSNPAVGYPFTIVYATSDDLLHWTMMDMMRYSYDRERYTACPVIRWLDDGYYYMINLEAMPLCHYVPFIVRTKDFEHYELGLKNPVLWYDDNDKILKHPEMFTEEEKEEILGAVDVNNSDVDICEYNGKTVILYSWGNQHGLEYLAEAEYDGSMKEFLQSFFPSSGL